jgi:ABC-type transport system involved in cytochrome bd biosynthesis fused ATPase/permease subunit
VKVTADENSNLSRRFYGILIASGLLISLQAFLLADIIIKASQEEARIEDLLLNFLFLALTLVARPALRFIGEQYTNPPERWFFRKVSRRSLFIPKISGGRAPAHLGEPASDSEESLIPDDEGLKSLGRIKELRWTDCEVLFPEDRSVTFRWGIATTGKLTIVTGPSSSGKSTLFNSLMRNTELHEGRIFVETSKGTFRLDELDLDYWLDQISWIPATPHFISGTIESNLKFIKPRANRERLTEILRSVQLDPESLPDGLQTSTDIQDQALTDQQRRKLAVARAILKDSPIFLVDSPKDSDPVVELEIYQILKAQSREGKLVILITEEPESLSLADRRITFEAERLTPTRILEAAQ